MPTPKKALITGITGEIGSCLTDFLLARNYNVHGIVRDPHSISKYHYHEIYKGTTLHQGDVRDAKRLKSIIEDVQPDEIYHLAGLTQVQHSWDDPELWFDVNHLGLVRLLQAVVESGLGEKVRILNAGSSEMFGLAEKLPIDEGTPIAPRTPYGTSKAAGYWTVRNFREKYGLFAVTAIMFNHESERRGQAFTTYQIAQGVAQTALGLRTHIEVGNLELVRDWGHAQDGVECMWLALQHDVADDYILASGVPHSVRDFVETAFKAVGIMVRWKKSGSEEVGIDAATEKVIVKIDKAAYAVRAQSNSQIGDPSKARRILGWERKKSFEDTVTEMTTAAYEREKSAMT